MLILLIALVPLISVAQSNKEASIGFGPSFFGWGDVTAVAMTSTYSLPISKHFDFEPRVILSTGWNYSGQDITTWNSYGQTSYLAAATSIVYTPFSGWGDFFKLKSGFLIGKMAHSYGNQQFGEYSYSDSNFDTSLDIGLIHTINFRLLDKEQFFVGTEISMLTSFSEGYYNCDGFIWNFMVGYKF